MSKAYGRLDRVTILDAALRVAARPGVADIRLSDVGDEVGADPTAVYRHFRGKQDLIAAAIERLMGEIAARIPAGVSWRALLDGVAADLFDTFSRLPAIGMHLADVRVVGSDELGLVERILQALQDAGLRDDALVKRYAALSGFSTAYLAGACRDLTTVDAAADELPWLPEAVDATDTRPLLATYAERIAALDFRAVYDAAIALILDSIEPEAAG
ncbi:MAG TPA: helix-turn-helix domain-containing protein [Pseudolysinimonas sp.]|nr:helix-turn-helix domain-containing protein [Pseudolysinimonas sp.]